MAYRLVATCPHCAGPLETICYSDTEAVLLCKNTKCHFVEKLPAAVRKAMALIDNHKDEAVKIVEALINALHPDTPTKTTHEEILQKLMLLRKVMKK